MLGLRIWKLMDCMHVFFSFPFYKLSLDVHVIAAMQRLQRTDYSRGLAGASQSANDVRSVDNLDIVQRDQFEHTGFGRLQSQHVACTFARAATEA